MERREFLVSTLAFCGASLLALQGCLNYKTVATEELDDKVSIKKSDFGEDKFVVVKSNKMNGHTFVSKQEDGTYSAVSMICTHKQCEVKPSGNMLVCPCHGAEFAFDGKVRKEPAEKDLIRYQTSSDDTTIFIHLK